MGRGQSSYKTFLSFHPYEIRKHFALADHHASTKCSTVLHTCVAVTKSDACICGAFRARLNTLFVQSVPRITQDTKFQLHALAFTPTLLQHYILFCEEIVSSVTSGFRRGVNKSSLFWDVTQRKLVISDVSKPIGSIFKVKQSKTNAYRARLSSVFIFHSNPFSLLFFHTFSFALFHVFTFFPSSPLSCT